MEHELNGKKVSDRAQDAGYKYFLVEENIAYNQKDAAAVVTAWMNSPHHRENLLNPDITQIGIGIALNAKGEPYYTQDFGRPESAGAKATAKFTVTNHTAGDVIVSMANTLEPHVVIPRAALVITVGSMGEFPPVHVQAGAAVMDFAPHNRDSYGVVPRVDGIAVELEAKTP
jgi:hypothetical protein